MPKGLPQKVKDHLEKCRWAVIAAVESYNRPSNRYRTALYIVLITIAWTALFHAVFNSKNRRPWYRKKTSGRGTGVRYVRIDGEPKHWELAECLKQYYRDQNPPERRNLEFLIGLRNKIEHRDTPELDASLYGECQASLINLEAMLVEQFGERYALTDQLAVSLQFSKVSHAGKLKAIKSLATGSAKSVGAYVEQFRGNLPSNVLNSIKYSYNVFLVPKLVNRASAADAAVEFVHVDEASEEQQERLEKLNVLIKDKHIPIANLNMYKPSQVVDELCKRASFRVTMHTHTQAWKFFGVRPPYGASHPERTESVYCVYDKAHRDYLYTQAWINKLEKELSSAEGYNRVVDGPQDMNDLA